MRDGLHRTPDRYPRFHLQDHNDRSQCDGKCCSKGDGCSCQIWPQEYNSPGHPQLCYGDIIDQICNPGKRSGLRKDCKLDQAILFPTKYLTILGSFCLPSALFILICRVQHIYCFFIVFEWPAFYYTT